VLWTWLKNRLPLLGRACGSLFGNDLALERYDNSTLGNGLPQDQQQRLAGTHSGFMTILPVAGENDRFPHGSLLVDYDGTYKLNALAGTPLQKGQVTARGVFLVDTGINPLEPPITLRSLVARAPTPQLMERPPRRSRIRTAGCSTSSCRCGCCVIAL
jgi:hypothetical protein